MSETTAEATGPVRAFWPNDYKRFAGAIRSARIDQGDEAADAIATTIVSALAADNPDFDAELFLRGTFKIPSYVGILAQALKVGTHVHCQPWTPAPALKVATVQALATDLTETLAAVVPHFSAETFMKSVEPPAPKVENTASVDTYGEDDEDEDDEPYAD